MQVQKQIVVTKQGRLQSTHLANRRAMRVGNDARCDIHIDDSNIAPHLMTVKISGDAVTIFSKSSAVQAVDGNEIRENESAQWALNATVTIAGGYELQLEASDASSLEKPKRGSQLTDEVIYFEKELPPDPAPSGSSLEPGANLSRLAAPIIVLVLFALVFLMALLFLNGSGSNAGRSRDFNALVQNLGFAAGAEAPSSSSPTLKEIHRILTRAIQDPESQVELLREARQMLLKRNPTACRSVLQNQKVSEDNQNAKLVADLFHCNIRFA